MANEQYEGEEKRIMDGVMFCPGDPALKAIKLKTHNLNLEYNQLREDETEKRNALIKEMLGDVGEGCFFQGPIFFHYGKHIHVGDHLFANFNLTIQDDATVTIGNHCDFGPNITIVTPCHPMIYTERLAMKAADGTTKRLCYAKPVTIGNNCWIGASVTICPGVTIGDGCVIGAGSVVTRDIPANSFAAGDPCRVIREITEKDSMKYKSEYLGGASVLE